MKNIDNKLSDLILELNKDIKTRITLIEETINDYLKYSENDSIHKSDYDNIINHYKELSPIKTSQNILDNYIELNQLYNDIINDTINAINKISKILNTILDNKILSSFYDRFKIISQNLDDIIERRKIGELSSLLQNFNNLYKDIYDYTKNEIEDIKSNLSDINNEIKEKVDEILCRYKNVIDSDDIIGIIDCLIELFEINNNTILSLQDQLDIIMYLLIY